jgi:hypothetical protein
MYDRLEGECDADNEELDMTVYKVEQYGEVQ